MMIEDFNDVLESNLIILSPNEESLAFGDLIEEIFDECYGYIKTAHFDDSFVMSRPDDYDIELQKHQMALEEFEANLKKSVKETYVQIQNCLKKE